MRIELEIALQFALGMLETFSRRDCGLILAGFRQTASDRQLERLLDRWRQQQLIDRTGRGRTARFRITDKGRQRAQALDPVAEWDRRWDGNWRVFSFDLPESRRKDRLRLWRHLRTARFGFLQRSVWVWPHDVESALREMVEARGVPECFCGFEVSRLFLCDAAEIVVSAWDWRKIQHDHAAYLQQGRGDVRMLRAAGRLEELSRIARVEQESYRAAFQSDPLLPRPLWPEAYQGPIVQERHREFHACLRERIRRVAGK